MKQDQGKKRPKITIREMELDYLTPVYHLGERLFTASEVPNLYRTWDDYELVELFNSDSEFCLIAESEEKLIGFALGTTIEKERSAWKYGYLIWLGVIPEFQRAGVAARLFERLKELMTNQGALRFLALHHRKNVEK